MDAKNVVIMLMILSIIVTPTTSEEQEIEIPGAAGQAGKLGCEASCAALCSTGGFNLVCFKADLVALYGGDTPKMAQEAYSQLDLKPRWPLGEEYAEGRSSIHENHQSLTSIIQESLQQLKNVS